MAEQYTPKVNVAKELSEISKDFTHPRELVRETISNSLDASAGEIWIEAVEDDTSGDKELAIRIIDNGTGMDRNELEGFFDLGYSKKRNPETAIGEKGHGTKIAYNSSQITVYSRSIGGSDMWCATLKNPKRELTLAVRKNENPPVVTFDKLMSSNNKRFDNMVSGTFIELRGYDGNNVSAFAHGPLKDYVQWFTGWGRIDIVWGGKPTAPCKLYLKGIGESEYEEIPYGHPLPPENDNFRSLRGKDDRRPENFFVKRWVSDDILVKDHPTAKIRVVFSVEGDSAKRESNEMLKRVGRQAAAKPYPYSQYRYNVSDRYGIYFCKDCIPIERKNEIFTQTSEWTKWHAFVNCQEFHLTANRSSVENTPAGLLEAIKETAREYIEANVFDSDEYLDFKERMKIEEGRRKAEKEKREVTRRWKQSQMKKRYMIDFEDKRLEFLEPRSEQGVLWLLAKITQLWPEKFPWLNVLDIDAHFGYDLLVRKKHMLSDELEPAFVEIKYELRDGEDFNHSFDYLFGVVCWETRIQPDNELLDIQQHKRIVKISPRNKERNYTQCFLNNPSGGTNIEVTVLKKYLDETLGLRESEPE